MTTRAEPSPPSWPRAKDPAPYDHLSRRLLVPGWAGDLSQEEYGFLRASLERSNRLRTLWGYPAGERRLIEEAIRLVARVGDPQDFARNAALVRQCRATAIEGDSPATEVFGFPSGSPVGRPAADVLPFKAQASFWPALRGEM
ncbi:MAG: hypothetical protein HY680_11010 [Chloroflexi bacterium]|nr:hypothetical protein [Chloroflexota bacterium]